jgi:hypothetical protein
MTTSGSVKLPRRTALVAILDALGAADYSVERVHDYLDARIELLDEVTRFAEQKHKGLVRKFSEAKLDWFVFQDTIILVYLCRTDEVALNEIAWFGLVLRAFLARAIGKNLLFRGAFAAGQLYKVSSETNTVLGPVVRDAARWYERANWMGVNATPRTTLLIQSLVTKQKDSVEFALVPYAVPLKQPSPGIELQSVNWPKGLHLRYPNNDAAQIRGIGASCLAHDEIPVGAEQEHFHSLDFFDHVVKTQAIEEPWTVRVSSRSAKNPAKR